MKTLLIGDLHIEEPAIDELHNTFKEVFTYKADSVIQLGDFFQFNRPTPKELDFGTDLICKLKKKYKKVTILSGTGSHDTLHGHSVINFFKHLKVNAVGTTYEETIDNLKCCFGHWMTNKSILEYGSYKHTITELAKYDLVVLGHQHQYQQLTDKIYHLNSVRFQNFNETVDKYKRIAMIEDGKLTFIPLKSPIPMVDVYSIEELDKLDANTKARLIISDFSEYKKAVMRISEWDKKFEKFRLKCNYEKTDTKVSEVQVAKITNQDLIKVLKEEVNKIKDKEVKDILLKQFKEEGMDLC